MENQEQQPQQPEVKEQMISAAPRHKGKALVKKAKSFADIEAEKQIKAVQLWSTRMLTMQLQSPRISNEMKTAIETELEKRSEKK